MNTAEHAIEILLIANGLLLAIACFAIVRLDRRCRQIEAFWGSPTGSAIADTDGAQSSAQLRIAQRLEQRVGELQRTVKIMDLNRAEEKQPARPVEIRLPIDNAVRMARQGASIEELTRNCGLNIGEARLMQKLHGHCRQTATGA